MRLDHYLALMCCGFVLLLTACHLPQWRVFQKTVDAKMAEKPPEQTEAERRGASYIWHRSAQDYL